MLAAACSAVQPRPVFYDPVPEAAMAYVQQVRISMGRGSFMVSIKAPVDLEATQAHIGETKDVVRPSDNADPHAVAERRS
jgi:pyrroline-5-carboxylate reductase